MFENNQEQKNSGSSDMMNIMGLWENTDKRGNKYLNGSLGGIRVLIFKNTYKQGEREPDYRLYVAKRQPQEGGGYNPQASAGEASQAEPTSTQAPKPTPEKEDDIPF